MDQPVMKVGELARRTGLSVRTLHHYDEIGLLRPSARTPAGHRLYTAREVERLQQIISLRRLGLSLERIRECLSGPGYGLEEVLAMQLRHLDDEIRELKSLRARLEGIRERLASADGISLDELTAAIQSTARFERHYTPEQLERFRERRDALGPEGMKAAEQAWSRLLDEYADAMRRGLDPGDDAVRALARRSAELVRGFTGGDPGVEASLRRLYREEGGERVMSDHGMNVPPGLWEYMARASRALAGEDG